MNEHARLPASLFDDFVADRPDDERWELIEGSFVMQAQPNIDHQIIAQNLASLLNVAFRENGIARFALQNPSVDLSPILVGNKFVPDVAVLDRDDVEPGLNTLMRCRLAAEIVSPSDRKRVVRRGRQKLEIKRDGYASLPDCELILIVEQDRFAGMVGRRMGDAWTWIELTAATDELILPGFGLRCRLGDLYAGTSLALGKVRRSTTRG